MVNWAAPSHGKCSPEVTNTVHIEHYEIKKGGIGYEYELIFKANKSGSYYFTDATNDTYKVGVISTFWKHSLKYNSSNPTIIRVDYVDY